MKAIIDVEIKCRKADLCKAELDLLSVGLFEDAKVLDKQLKELDLKLDGVIEKILKLGDFKGKKLTSSVIYTNGKIGAKRLLLVGLGEKKGASLDTIRKAAAISARKAVGLKAGSLGLALHVGVGKKIELSAAASACAEGIYFGSFEYDEYVTEEENGRLKSLKVELLEADGLKAKKLAKGADRGIIIGSSQSYARTLANRPGNAINPPKLAEIAKKIAKDTPGLTCTIFDEKQLKAKGMGGILAVGAGSKSAPRFIVLKYSPKVKVPKARPVVGLVGKAITFDSGGISIKPSNNMEQMKLDKSGGIAVLGVLKAIAELKLAISVYGIIPAAENMPSGTSYRPGDIITTYSGKTVEIQSTDAEGRMILCDGLHYAVEQKCDIIIDIATLTGACMVALGKFKAGLMGNDDRVIKQLQSAAEQSGESVWQLPCGDEYAKEMKSKIADLRNTGGRWGGACTGAAFLRQFVSEAKWAHLDMAGVDMIEKGSEFSAEGASGFGVRLLTSYIINLCGKS